MQKHSDLTDDPVANMRRLRGVATDAFDLVFENSKVMMYAVDHNFRIAKVNHYWREVMGFQHGEVFGRKPAEFGTEESQAYVYSKVSPSLD